VLLESSRRGPFLPSINIIPFRAVPTFFPPMPLALTHPALRGGGGGGSFRTNEGSLSWKSLVEVSFFSSSSRRGSKNFGFGEPCFHFGKMRPWDPSRVETYWSSALREIHPLPSNSGLRVSSESICTRLHSLFRNWPRHCYFPCSRTLQLLPWPTSS